MKIDPKLYLMIAAAVLASSAMAAEETTKKAAAPAETVEKAEPRVGSDEWLKEISDKNAKELDAQIRAREASMKAAANRFKLLAKGDSYGCVNPSGQSGLNALSTVMGLLPRDLDCTDLSGTKLLFRANFEDRSLRGASLRGADLRWTNLAGADLRGADLRDIDFSKTTLVSASPMEGAMSAADLRGADLRGADISMIDPKLFKEILLKGAKYDDTSVFFSKEMETAIKAQTGMTKDQVLVHVDGMVKLGADGKPAKVEAPAPRTLSTLRDAGEDGAGAFGGENKLRQMECLEKSMKAHPGAVVMSEGRAMVKDHAVAEELMKCIKGDGR